MAFAIAENGKGIAPCYWCQGRGYVFGVATTYAFRCLECEGTGQVRYVSATKQIEPKTVVG